jgi:hypothetical protein
MEAYCGVEVQSRSFLTSTPDLLKIAPYNNFKICFNLTLPGTKEVHVCQVVVFLKIYSRFVLDVQLIWRSSISQHKNLCYLWDVSKNILLYAYIWGGTAQLGNGPNFFVVSSYCSRHRDHQQSDTHTHTHTHRGRTRLDEWLPRHKGHYLHNTQPPQQMDIYALRGTRTRDPMHHSYKC